MAAELERKAERVRLGLDDAAPTPVLSDDFFTRYLDEVVALQKDAATMRWTFSKWITPYFKGRSLGSITPADAQRWVTMLAKSGAAPVTQKNIRVRFSAALNVARRWGYIRSNPLEHVKTARVPRKDPTYLEIDEITALLAHVPPEWQVCVKVAICTGLRRGELFGMRKSWIDLKRQTIRAQASYDDASTKSGKARTTPIPDDLLPELTAHVAQLGPDDLVFPRPNGEMYGPNDEPSVRLREWAKAAGIKKHLVWHNLRATYATHAAEMLGSRFAQIVMGHADLRTTEIYTGRSSALTAKGRKLRLVSGADATTTGPDDDSESGSKT